MQHSLGPVMHGFAPPMPDANDGLTVSLGCLARFARYDPVVDPPRLAALARFVDEWLVRNLRPLEPTDVLDYNEYIDQTEHPRWRKDELKRAAASLTLTPLSKEDYLLKSFCKREVYGEYKHARGINSRSDRFKVYSGRVFHAIEKLVFSRPEFIKKVPLHMRPAYMREVFFNRPGPYYETDYSKFESHFSKQILEALEFRLYRYMLAPHFKEELMHIEKALSGLNVCRYKNFTLKVRGKRMSGDMCTSLGNGFSNLMLAMYVAELVGGGFAGVVEGDDGLFVAAGTVTKRHFNDLGFDIKILSFENLNSTTFCCMNFSGDGCLITDPRDVLVNFGWSHSYFAHSSDAVRRQLLKAKALSLLYEYPRCPIVTPLALRVNSLLDGVVPRWDGDWYSKQILQWALKFGVDAFSHTITTEARVAIAKNYGIDMAQQLAAESAISTMGLGSCHDERLLVLLADLKDCADYFQRFVHSSDSVVCYHNGWTAADFNLPGPGKRPGGCFVEYTLGVRCPSLLTAVLLAMGFIRSICWTKIGGLNLTLIFPCYSECQETARLPMPDECTVPFLVRVSHTNKMENRSSKRDPRVFENLETQGKITADGKEWLTCALDPFHDWNKPLAGYPDADGSSTIVQCYQYSSDVVFAGGVNWDCHIMTNPIMDDTAANFYIAGALGETGIALEAGANTLGTGALTIVTCNAGGLLAPTPAAQWGPAGLAITNLGTVTDLIKSNSRIIAMGFEVINTTAELNKQGACTCYRMPTGTQPTFNLVTNAADTANGTTVWNKIREAPATVAAANLLRGTTQWSAAEGCYIVCTQNTVDNPISNTTTIGTLRSPTGHIANGEHVMGTGVSLAAVAKPTTAYFGGKRKATPFEFSGAMFTGLSATSTLRVRLRVYTETAPTSQDPGLAVLATPSATYDSAALKFYSEIAPKMPVACPVSMNAFADWWAVISDIAKTVAVPVSTALAGPGGAVIGAGIAGGFKGMDALIGAYNTRKVKPPTPQGRRDSASSEDATRRRRKQQRAKQ